jgi:Fe-S cluster assembly protein SufD
MNGGVEIPERAPPGVAIGVERACAETSDHPLARLAAALTKETLVIDIDGEVAQPILIRRVAGAGAVHARAEVRLAQGASATVIESFDGAGAFFSNSAIRYDIGARGALTRIIRQNAGEAGVETAFAAIGLGEAARLDQTALLFGGKMARMETSIACEGGDTRVSLRSAAALSGARHVDATSLVAHRAIGGQTRQLHRAALKDRARGVFQGKFLVARSGQKTDAEMNAGALLLSDMAEANHKPELEIYADDVKCAHGSTAGALDENAIFYMRQRGLSEHGARALLVEAFLGEVFDALPAGIEHILRGQLSRWLEGV